MPRIIVRVELTPSAKDAVNQMCDHAGMTQVAMLSRAIEWIAAQDEMVKSAILGQYPKAIEADIAKIILKRMSGKRKKEPAVTVEV
jgi:hypothetical protein